MAAGFLSVALHLTILGYKRTFLPCPLNTVFRHGALLSGFPCRKEPLYGHRSLLKRWSCRKWFLNGHGVDSGNTYGLIGFICLSLTASPPFHVSLWRGHMAQLNPRSAPHVRPKWTHGASTTSSGEESSSARRCRVPGLNAFPRPRDWAIDSYWNL